MPRGQPSPVPHAYSHHSGRGLPAHLLLTPALSPLSPLPSHISSLLSLLLLSLSPRSLPPQVPGVRRRRPAAEDRGDRHGRRGGDGARALQQGPSPSPPPHIHITPTPPRPRHSHARLLSRAAPSPFNHPHSPHHTASHGRSEPSRGRRTRSSW